MVLIGPIGIFGLVRRIWAYKRNWACTAYLGIWCI